MHVSNEELAEAVLDVDLAEICITSALTLVEDEGPAAAFRLPDVAGVAVVPNLAEGTKCARSWKVLTNIGEDPQFPEVSPRDAQALREWEAMRKAAECNTANLDVVPAAKRGLITDRTQSMIRTGVLVTSASAN